MQTFSVQDAFVNFQISTGHLKVAKVFYSMDMACFGIEAVSLDSLCQCLSIRCQYSNVWWNQFW